MEAGQQVASGVWAVETDLPYADDGHLVVDVRARGGSGLASRLPAAGIDVLFASADGSDVRAHLNIDQVEGLAADPDVLFIQPRQEASLSGQAAVPNLVAPTGQGSHSSEGDVTHLAFAARGAFHVDGTGLKIGVLSDGVRNLAASQTLGDLGAVTVIGPAVAVPGREHVRRRDGDARDRPRPRARRAALLRQRLRQHHQLRRQHPRAARRRLRHHRRRRVLLRRDAVPGRPGGGRRLHHQRRRGDPGGEGRHRRRRAVLLVGRQLGQPRRRDLRRVGRRFRRRRRDRRAVARRRARAQLRRTEFQPADGGEHRRRPSPCTGPIRWAARRTTTICSGSTPRAPRSRPRRPTSRTAPRIRSSRSRRARRTRAS